jgi:hypothetical protein
MGAACPLATARLYAACEGYLGGGGSTLEEGIVSDTISGWQRGPSERCKETYNMVSGDAC